LDQKQTKHRFRKKPVFGFAKTALEPEKWFCSVQGSENPALALDKKIQFWVGKKPVLRSEKRLDAPQKAGLGFVQTGFTVPFRLFIIIIFLDNIDIL